MSLQRADLTLAACQDHLELQNILVSGCTPEILVDLVLGLDRVWVSDFQKDSG